MKMQPCAFLYIKKHFFFKEVLEIMSIQGSKTPSKYINMYCHIKTWFQVVFKGFIIINNVWASMDFEHEWLSFTCNKK